MIPHRLLLFGFALLSHAAPVPAGDVVVRWNGKNYTSEALPEGFPAAARASVELWAPWCERCGYRMDLEDGARVLLIVEDRKAPSKEMRLVERVVELFEREFAVPERESGEDPDGPPKGATEAGGGRQDSGPLPEDPEGSDHPWEVRGSRGLKPDVKKTSWGAENVPFDHDPAVFVLAKGQEDYRSLLDHLAREFEYLEVWKSSAAGLQGFVNAWPLTASFMRIPDGVEEWSPNNELVNRLARLLFLRRYGRQPYWVELGVGWHFEVELLGGVYVFPYRDEFVYAVEHAAWPGDLQRRFSERKDEPLRGEEFFEYERGEYLPFESRLSFGFVHFLARSGHENLPAFFEGLRRIHDEESVIRTGAYSWKRDLSYRIPAEEQEALAKELLGQAVFEKASRALRRGFGKKRRK